MKRIFTTILVVVYLFGLAPISSANMTRAKAGEAVSSDENEVLSRLQSQQKALSAVERNLVDKKLKNQPTKSPKDNFNKFLPTTKANNTVKQSYVQGEVLVKFKNQKINLRQSAGIKKSRLFAESKNLDKKEDIRKSNISVLKTKSDESVEEMVDRLKNDPDVEYVEPNYIHPWTSTTPNDLDFDKLWGLHNTNDVDIDAPEAWDISTGSASVVVAVLDSGIAYNHPDLINNMWDGATGCKNENNQNVSCPYHGWDYTNNDNNPIDDHGHGTHVAGTIGAEGDNGIGVSGISWNVKLMALKVGNYKGAVTGDVVKAIDFAIHNGVKVINASFGGSNSTQAEYDAIGRFRDAGGIFIAAAGNDANNNDGTHYYPSDYDLDNIISVAATDQNDELASFSNYGATSVDVGAPGVGIYSTVAGVDLFSENFEEDTYIVSHGGDTTSHWVVNNDGSSKVVYSDNSYPYDSDAHTWLLQSDALDLSDSNISSASLSFTIWCDTPISITYDDYINTYYYSNGFWHDSNKYDEFKIFLDGGKQWTDDGHSGYYKNYSEDISNYLSSDFKFSFDWITDSSIDYNLGCTIDDIKITKYSDGSDEQYGYKSGTSMVAPHVAGLAGLIWGYRPELTYSEVKNVILTTGDDNVDLLGKTVSGKRINAFNALNSLTSENFTISGTVKYYDGIKAVPNSTVILENNVGAQIAVAITDASGYYEFTGLENGENYVVKIEKDDAITSTEVNGLDLTKIVRHITGLETFDSIFKIVASDADETGKINGLDLTKIVRYIVGFDSELPSGDWKFYSSDTVLTEENYLTEEPSKTYTDLTADMTNQNFTGVKMGDVNNSWNNN
ncbi:MAG: S8 family serine peptidase [bacterium]